VRILNLAWHAIRRGSNELGCAKEFALAIVPGASRCSAWRQLRDAERRQTEGFALGFLPFEYSRH
jgi:hypothetical protein